MRPSSFTTTKPARNPIQFQLNCSTYELEEFFTNSTEQQSMQSLIVFYLEYKPIRKPPQGTPIFGMTG